MSMVAHQNHCAAQQKAFSHTIEQLLHQYHKILALCNIKAWFPLVLRIVRVGDFYDLLTSEILTTSLSTPSQTSQTIGHFYDVIGRIGSISILKVLSPTSAIITMSVNIKFVCLGSSPTIGDFYNKCEHEICMSGTSGMLDFVFTCYQSLTFSKL